MITLKCLAATRQLSNKIIRNSAFSFNSVKYSSSNTKKDLVLVEVNDKTGFSTVTLNSPPVNSLNLELLTTFSNVLDDLKNDNSRGVILTSSAKTVFSAGLDINEMYKPDKERLRKFWSALQDCWIKLYGSGFPTAALINGHSPAGGCLFAMCCEYRVMLPKFTIGLNETQLGIVAPKWFMATMRNTIHPREAELALTLGRMYKTDEALKVGMIDEIASDKADAYTKCEAFLLKYKNIPPKAREITKMSCRMNDIKELENNRAADIDLFATTIVNDGIQKSLGKYIALLKWKKKLKPVLDAVKFVQNLFKPQKKR